MSDNTRVMRLAINVPAYCKVEIPDGVGESEAELREFAGQVFADWAVGAGGYVFEPEWDGADESSERVVTVDELDGDGWPSRSISEGFEMNPTPATLDGLRGAEVACRDGFVVQGYLLASTAHITCRELGEFVRGSSPCKELIVSATCEHGALVELSDALFHEDADHDALLGGLSDGAQTVVRKALSFGLRSVRFDSVGPVLPHTQTYAEESARSLPGMSGP